MAASPAQPPAIENNLDVHIRWCQSQSAAALNSACFVDVTNAPPPAAGAAPGAARPVRRNTTFEEYGRLMSGGDGGMGHLEMAEADATKPKSKGKNP